LGDPENQNSTGDSRKKPARGEEMKGAGGRPGGLCERAPLWKGEVKRGMGEEMKGLAQRAVFIF